MSVKLETKALIPLRLLMVRRRASIDRIYNVRCSCWKPRTLA
jgi:hypothetical protein